MGDLGRGVLESLGMDDGQVGKDGVLKGSLESGAEERGGEWG